jgi:hypothetical protein
MKDDAGWKFIHALSNSESMSYFELDSVKLIVRYQWMLIKPIIIKYLFVPFLLNFLLFNVYCIYLFEAAKPVEVTEEDVTTTVLASDTIVYSKMVVQIVLMLFTLHTIYVETKQMIFHKAEYFQSFWNLLDIIVVLMQPIIVILNVIDPTNGSDYLIRPLMAICLTIFYMRFFYFLRIFDSSAPLVAIIVAITGEI